jgi:hypothetical protein
MRARRRGATGADQRAAAEGTARIVPHGDCEALPYVDDLDVTACDEVEGRVERVRVGRALACRNPGPDRVEDQLRAHRRTAVIRGLLGTYSPPARSPRHPRARRQLSSAGLRFARGSSTPSVPLERTLDRLGISLPAEYLSIVLGSLLTGVPESDSAARDRPAAPEPSRPEHPPRIPDLQTRIPQPRPS